LITIPLSFFLLISLFTILLIDELKKAHTCGVVVFIGWFVAWKLVLVHVPLVQEVFGLKKKAVRVKPPTGRFSKIYGTLHAKNSPSTS